MGNFKNYIKLREDRNPLITKIKLTRDNEDFQPFVVDKNNHKNLRVLIKVFENSPQIGVGYTTVDKSKGEVEPKLKKKTLYLTGGAVRDHLKGKTPRNYDLSTDATASEIRMILSDKDSGFKEINPEEANNSGSDRYFYVGRKSKNGNELEFTIVINGEEFYLSPFSNASKSRRIVPDSYSAASLEDDAATRDTTMNAMYIPLKNSDGDNSELIDIYGGAHHLKNGKIVYINGFSKHVKEDPMNAHRMIRLQTKYGSDEPNEKMFVITRNISGINPEYKKEYLYGLENSDTDVQKYLNLYSKSGLLNTVYPVDNLETDVPEKCGNDKFLVSAWMLKNNNADKTKFALSSAGWGDQEVKDIVHLIKLYQSFKNRYFTNYNNSSCGCGLPSYKIDKWKSLL